MKTVVTTTRLLARLGITAAALLLSQQALAMALEDGSPLVQTVAEQILIQRGLSPMDIKELRAAKGRSEVGQRFRDSRG